MAKVDKERKENMKKRKKMLKYGLDEYREPDPQLYAVPHSAQEMIDIVSVSESGIFELPGKKYSSTWEIEDINYNLANDDEREEIQFRYSSQIISVMQYPFKLTIINRKKNTEKLKEEYFYKENPACKGKLREYVNDAIEDWVTRGRHGYEQEKYITVSAERNNKDEAIQLMKIINDDLKKGFSSIDSSIKQLNGDERLNLLSKILNPESNIPLPTIREMYESGRDYKNEILPDKGFDFSDKKCETFKIGDKVCTAMYATKYPNVLSDSFMEELTNLPVEAIISIDAVPINADTARKFVEGIYMDVEEAIGKQQEKRNKNRAYATDISYKKRREKEDVEAYMDELREADQRMLLAGLTILVVAETEDELEAQVNSIKTVGSRYTVDIENAWLYQREYFATALPIGNRQISKMRPMLSSDIAALIPFQAASLKTSGVRICYGTNQVSGEPIFGNRKKLSFGGGFYFGKPGSGKSQDAKQEMAAILASTDDDIIVIDPTFEYEKVCDIFDGEFFEFSPTSQYHLNPLDIELELYEDSKALQKFINDTSDYMISQCALMMEGEILSGHRTIISRAVRALYEDIAALPKNERYIPIMGDLRKVISGYEEKEAVAIALAMELYTDGAFSMFNHQTNISLKKRFTAFGIRDVGKNMYGQAMLAITRHIDKRIRKNFEMGRSTWVYTDEIHRIIKNPISADYMDRSWRENRKFNAINTGLTHTIEEILKNDIAESMVKNSEFLFILKSSKTSVNEMLTSIEGMKPELFRFMINAPVGTGILKHGAQLIPVDGRLSEENPLSRVFNTDPHKYADEES